jgi:hypothetical protein
MNRFVSIFTASAIATLALASAPSALACGDKLTVLGGGIPFDKIHTNHRHGSLIMYLSPDSRLSATNNDARIDQALTRDGHQVKVVQSSAELKQALDSGQADFVLIDWSEAQRLQPGVIAKVPIVPVTYDGDAGERALAQSRSGCVVQSNKRHSREMVHEVEDLLENQSALASSCAGSLAAASG